MIVVHLNRIRGGIRKFQGNCENSSWPYFVNPRNVNRFLMAAVGKNVFAHTCLKLFVEVFTFADAEEQV